MKFSLSTNWCNRRIERGEDIAAKALELGFQELELGFHTTAEQVAGFKKMLDKIPVGSVHAFCPVPLSAPTGYPELYSLASFDKASRQLAAVHVKKNIAFAAEMGADTLVLHAGRVGFSGLFQIAASHILSEAFAQVKYDRSDIAYHKRLMNAVSLRYARGRKMLKIFIEELKRLVEELERNHVTLALENLPYLEGFPNEEEMAEITATFSNAPIKAWFDTGHDRVRYMHAWKRESAFELTRMAENYQGMHLNDVVDFSDDHLAPGEGKVDFAALKDFAAKMKHVVFEPKGTVDEAKLVKGMEFIRKVWGL